MKSHGFIVIAFLTSLLTGCHTQKEIEAYALANPVSHVSSDYSAVGSKTALLGREHLIGKWQTISHVDWARYNSTIWGIRKWNQTCCGGPLVFDVTLVYDFKDDGHVDLNVSVSRDQQRLVVAAKGQWTYNDGILKILLGEEKWDGTGDGGFAHDEVAQGLLFSGVQKGYWGDLSERIITWYGEDTIVLGWADIQNYRGWWAKFMQDYMWHQKSVTVIQIGDDGCWHLHSSPEDSVAPGPRMIHAVWDRLIFRRVVPQMNGVKKQNKNETLSREANALPNKPPYRIIDLAREKDSDFAYAFTLELSGDASIQTFFGIQAMFANEVRAAYQMEYPNANISTLRVVVQPRLSNGKIVGRAEVLTITPVSLSYDAGSRRGRLSVRFNPGQAEEARAWIRKNIETLARDKNIALMTGQLPPAATYYSLGEKIDGNVIEIEFKTE